MMDWLASLAGPLFGAVAAYAAIRADLAVLRVRLDHHDQRLGWLEQARKERP